MSDGTIAALAADIRARRRSPVEATQECLARIQCLDGRLRAFIAVDAEGALRAARALEPEAAAGRWRGHLHGVPLAFKDLCYIPGQPTPPDRGAPVDESTVLRVGHAYERATEWHRRRPPLT